MIVSVRKHRKYSYQKGMTYGRLTLTGKTFLQAMYGQQRRMVEADCICGVTGWYLFESLTSDHRRSCGCLQKEQSSKLGKSKITHGMRNHPLYLVWKGMKGRCYEKRHISYPNYGGRGISICDEWLEKPKLFFDWALSHGWQPGLDIDREKNDCDYNPDNCRFVPPKTSSRNRRSSRMITAFGETKCMTEWTEDPRCSVSVTRLFMRLAEGTWATMEELITAPGKIRGRNLDNRIDTRKIFAFGEEKSIADWLKDDRCLADEERIRLRLRKGINRGWTPKKAITTPVRKLPGYMTSPEN